MVEVHHLPTVRTLIFFIVLSPPLLLHSQTDRPINVEVRTLALSRLENPSEHYLKTEAGYKLLTISHRQPRKPIETTTDGTLRVYQKSGDNSRDMYEVYAEVPLPKEARSILLLVTEAPDGIQYRPVIDHYTEASHTDWLMINTTSQVITLQIGQNADPFFLEPDSAKTCKLDATHQGGLAITGKVESNGEFKTIYSTYWALREGARSIVIFLDEENRIQTKRITDPLPAGN